MSMLFRGRPGHSPAMHPKRDILGPEPLFDPRNYVPPLEPMYGPKAWDSSSEVGPRDVCERCGSIVRAEGIFCGGCHRVNRDHQRRLTAERLVDPKPDPKPKAKAATAPKTEREREAAKVVGRRAKRTARDQKRLIEAYRAFKGNPEAEAWAARVGLKVAS